MLTLCFENSTGIISLYNIEGGWMNAGIKIMAIILIVAGVLGLAYGQFSYTKEV